MGTDVLFNYNGTCITIGTEDAINLAFEVTEMLFGPFYLKFWAA